MSTTIDQKVVEMKFDNKAFEKGVEVSLRTIAKLKQTIQTLGETEGFQKIAQAIDDLDFNPMVLGVQGVQKEFDLLGSIGAEVIRTLTNKVTLFATDTAAAFTIEPITSGLEEYTTQIDSVQTILANTQKENTTVDDVNAALQQLNTYADQTIYNFTEMTRNIGTFTAAGVKLQDSVDAIQGIANLAAVSGSTSQQASTAMYQLSQALAAGKVSLQDWNSVVNAGMGGQVFQEALAETSRALGTGYDEAVKKYGTFRESLTQGGWLTAEVLTQTLKNFTGTVSKEELIATGYSEKQADSIIKMGQTATDAATKVKTFEQLMDTLKEEAQSGWTLTWQYIFGDYEEAKELFSGVAARLTTFVSAMSAGRNETLKFWHDNEGRAAVINGIADAFDGLCEMGRIWGVIVQNLIPPVTGEMLLDISFKFRKLAKSFKEAAMEMGSGNEATSAWFSIMKAITRVIATPINVVSKLVYVLSPLVRVLTDIPGLVGALLLPLSRTFNILNNLGGRTKIVTHAFEDMHDAVDVFATFLSGKIQDATKSLHKISTALYDLYQNILKKYGDTLDAIGRRDYSALENLPKTFINIKDALVGALAILGNFAAWVERTIFSIPQLTNVILAIPYALYKGSEALAGFITSLANSKDPIETAKKSFSSLSESAKSIASSLGDKFAARFPTVTKLFKDISSSVKELIANLTGGGKMTLTKVLDIFKSFGSEVASTFSDFFSGIDFSGVRDKIESLLPDIDLTDLPFYDTLNSLKERILSFVQTFTSGKLDANDISSVISDNIGVDKLGTVGEAAVTGIGSLTEGISKAFGFLSSVVSTFSSSFAGVGVSAILITFGATLSKVAAIVLPTISGLLEGGTGLIDGVKNLFHNAGEAIKQIERAKVLLVKSEALRNVALSLVMIVAALVILSMQPLGKVVLAGVIITAMGGVLLGMTIAINKIIKDGTEKKIQTFAIVIAVIAATILAIAHSLKTICAIPMEDIGSHLPVIIGVFFGVLAIIVVAAFAISKMTKKLSSSGQQGIKAAMPSIKQMGVLMVAISGLVSNMKKLASADTDKILASTIGLTGIMVAYGVLCLAIQKIGSVGGNNGKGGTAPLLAMGASLYAISKAVKTLGKMTQEELFQGILALGLITTIVTIMTVLTILMSRLGKEHESANNGKVLSSMGTTIAKLAVSMKLLGTMKGTAIAKAFLALTGLTGIIAILAVISNGLNSSGMDEKGRTKLESMAKCINILTKSVILLGALSLWAIAKGELAILGIAAILKFLSKSVEPMTEQSTKALLQVTICVVLIAATMAILSLLPWKKSLLATAELVILMGSLSAVFYVASKAADKIKMGPIIAMVVVIGIIGAVMYLLTEYSDAGSCLKVAIGMSAVIIAVAAAIKLMNGIDFVTAIKAAAGLSAALIVLSVGLIAAMAIIGLELPAFGTSLSNFMTNLGPFLDGMDRIANLPDGAAEKMSSLGGCIVAICAAEILDCIASFIDKDGGGLSTLGTSLSLFAVNALPFFTVMGGLNVDSLSAVSYLANAILAITAAEIIDGIASWITGGKDLGSFGESLGTLADGMCTFYRKTSEIKDLKVVKRAAKALQELVAIDVPKTGGLAGFICGDQDFSKFGEQLEPLGSGLSDFATALADTNMKDITKTKKALRMLVDINNDLPADGGLLQAFTGHQDFAKFGENLSELGEGLDGYAGYVAGIDNDAILETKKSLKFLVALANDVPSTGGLFGAMFGDKNFSKFGEQLHDFGYGLNRYSFAINNGNALDVQAISDSVKVATDLVGLSNSLEEQGGLKGVFFGDKNLGKFGDRLAEFAEGLITYSQKINDNSSDIVLASVNNASVVDIFDGLDGIDETLTALNAADLSMYTQNMGTIGQAVVDYSNKLKEADINGTLEMTTAANKIVALYERMSSVDTESANNFSTSLTKLSSSMTTALTLSSEDNDTASASGSGLVNSIASSITKGIGEKESSIKMAGQKLAKALMNGLRSINVTTQPKLMIASVISSLKGHTSDARTIGANISAGLANGISSGKSDVINAAAEVAAAAITAAKSKLKEKSPSRVFMGIGNYASEGLAIGIMDGAETVAASASSMASAAVTGVQNVMKQVADAFDSEDVYSPVISPVVDMSDVNASANTIMGIFGGGSELGYALNGIVGADRAIRSSRSTDHSLDIVKAISDLGSDIRSNPTTVTNVNGITYSNGTEIAEAVDTLVNAVIAGRR